MAEKVYLVESRRYLGATRSWALRIRKRTLYSIEQRLEASEVILEMWTLDNGHRASPMLAGTVIKKSYIQHNVLFWRVVLRGSRGEMDL